MPKGRGRNAPGGRNASGFKHSPEKNNKKIVFTDHCNLCCRFQELLIMSICMEVEEKDADQ